VALSLAALYDWSSGPERIDLIGPSLFASSPGCASMDTQRRSPLSDAGKFVNLNYVFTAHEKLELRLSLPREFWPKKWLDKANEE
jgi:hypothetical protein